MHHLGIEDMKSFCLERKTSNLKEVYEVVKGSRRVEVVGKMKNERRTTQNCNRCVRFA